MLRSTYIVYLVDFYTSWQWDVPFCLPSKLPTQFSVRHRGGGEVNREKSTLSLFMFRSFNSWSFQLCLQTAARTLYKRPWTLRWLGTNYRLYCSTVSLSQPLGTTQPLQRPRVAREKTCKCHVNKPAASVYSVHAGPCLFYFQVATECHV